MKKLLWLFLVICIVLFSACSREENKQSDFFVYNWNSVEHNGNKYSRYDNYGNEFKDYKIFYERSNKTVSADYFSNGEESGKTELKTYVGDIETNFISQVEHWYDLFEPLVFGDISNPRFNYLDDYNNVEKISIHLTSEEQSDYPIGEYILYKELSEEVWSVLSEMEKSKDYSDDVPWEKTDLECWIYLYIKDVNAAVYVGTFCYNTDGKLCISNTNYTKLYPLSYQWQDLDVLLKDCEYVKNSLLV